MAAKLRPVVSELRLHAERAIALVAEARAAASSRTALSKTRRRWMRWSWARAASTLSASSFRPADESAALYARRRRWPPTRAAGTRSRRCWEPSARTTGARRHSRRLRAAGRALPAGMAARQPALLAGDQPGPLRPLNATVGRPQQSLESGDGTVMGDAQAASGCRYRTARSDRQIEVVFSHPCDRKSRNGGAPILSCCDRHPRCPNARHLGHPSLVVVPGTPSLIGK